MALGLPLKSEPGGQTKQRDTSGLGLWSRSRALRITVWIIMVPAVLTLALYCSARLSGFASVLEMIDWLRVSFNI